MAISGDLRVSAALGPPKNPIRINLHSPPSKVDYSNFLTGGSGVCESIKWSASINHARSTHLYSKRPLGMIGDNEMSTSTTAQDFESFLFNCINMPLFERLRLAWKVIFLSSSAKRDSDARIAKERLKMVLYYDRCAVTDEAKQKIVTTVAKSLSDFLVIDSQDQVQLSVSMDPASGPIYSVSVRALRVKVEYQEENESGKIVNIEYKDTGSESGSMDVKFNFYLPSEDSL